VYKWYCVQCCYAALHTVSFVYGCFAGKCILTGSAEWRYFKVDGSMEKKWHTIIPADLKRLFISGIYVPLVTNGLKLIPSCTLYNLALAFCRISHRPINYLIGSGYVSPVHLALFTCNADMQHCTQYHLYTAVSRENAFWLVLTEYRYFKVDGSMEKKWDTVVPADLKRLFVSGIYVALVTKGLNSAFIS